MNATRLTGGLPFSLAARQRRMVSELLLRKLARHGYPETAIHFDTDLTKRHDHGTISYQLTFTTVSQPRTYTATAIKDGKQWRIELAKAGQTPEWLR